MVDYWKSIYILISSSLGQLTPPVSYVITSLVGKTLNILLLLLDFFWGESEISSKIELGLSFLNKPVKEGPWNNFPATK